MQTKAKTPTLTAQELVALKAAVASSAGNGHDFGCVEDVVIGLKPMKAAGRRRADQQPLQEGRPDGARRSYDG